MQETTEGTGQGRTVFGVNWRIRARGAVWLISAAWIVVALPLAANAVNVATYHYDNFRTGWSNAESTLTPAVVSGGKFGILSSSVLDGGADTQPLIVQGISIADGIHTVAYVASEQNSVYAFDAASGALLLKVNLGAPPPPSSLPLHLVLGIQSTPVIDTISHTLYVISYTYENSAPTYRIHALDLTIARKLNIGTAARCCFLAARSASTDHGKATR